jgi:hypothetical protein
MELNKCDLDNSSLAAICSNVAYGMRTTYHTELQATPDQVVYGCDMIINATYIADWKVTAAF